MPNFHLSTVPVTRKRSRAVKPPAPSAEAIPNAVRVLGGVHATFMFRQVLTEAPWVDVIVRGEGEATAKWLSRLNPDAAASLREGLEETLTRWRPRSVSTRKSAGACSMPSRSTARSTNDPLVRASWPGLARVPVR